MRLERPGAIAAGVGTAYAIKEGVSIPFPDESFLKVGSFVTGITFGEIHRRYRDSKLDDFGGPELAKLGLSAIGIWAINRGIEPSVLVNFAAGTGITEFAVRGSEKVYDLYEGMIKIKGKHAKQKQKKKKE